MYTNIDSVQNKYKELYTVYTFHLLATATNM